MRGLSWGALLSLLLCGCSAKEQSSALVSCVDGDVRCGAQCSASAPCQAGLYCTAEGWCAKQCVAGESTGCRDGSLCSESGKCLDPASNSGGEGGEGGSGSGPIAGKGGGAGAAEGGTGPAPCAQTQVKTKRVQPTVILIVDQSGSMTEDFGSGDRWNVLRDALLAKPNGLIAALASQVRFGLALYSADSSPENDNNGAAPPMVVGQCPAVRTVAPAIDNYKPISDLYSAQNPLDDTPTGDSINRILDDLDLAKHPSTDDAPIVFVLATDGAPDRCENLDPSQMGEQAMARAESVAAVKRAFDSNIRTYLISVGAEVAASHMREMANAGIGRAVADRAAEYWEPTSDQTLRAALTKIIGGEVTCDIALEGEVKGDHCLGTVELNGKRLACDDDNGWELTDSTHIRLVGTACDTLKNDAEATLDVSFPCEVAIIIPQ